MAVQTSFPGVYIEEFEPAPPIQGVSTSTAAFIGPAAMGDLNTPTKVTSWDQFQAAFGSQPLPGFYLWYAVQGFFTNGGQVCYIVRASNGTYAGLGLENPPTSALTDRAGNQIISVRAVQPGAPATAIQVQVAGTNRLTSGNTSLYEPTPPNYKVTSSRELQVTAGTPQDALAAAAQFRPGDWVDLDVADPRVQIVSISGVTFRFASPLNTPINNTGTMRLADAPAGAQTIRIQSSVPVPSDALVPGTLLTVTQGAMTDSQFVQSVQSEPLQTNPAITTYRVTFRQGLRIPLSLANPATVQSEEFNFIVSQGTASTTYANLSIDASHPRYFVTVINTSSSVVQVNLLQPPPADVPPQNMPANVAATALAGGTNENLATIGDGDYTNALDTLQQITDVNLVAIPDRTTAAVQQALIAHCELLADRFAVLDAAPGSNLFGANSIEAQRQGLDSTRGYAALYYPWLLVPPAGPGAPILVPPSGHVCGLIANTDLTRGVFKAPANVIVNGALGVERAMSDIEQGQLNMEGIDVIRAFTSGGRPVLWGARTTATDLNWQYINIRRLFLFLEKSIQYGIRWAVFEPNNQSLWQKLKRTLNDFLQQQWEEGALFGAKPTDAFYVRIDDVLNPFSEQALGRLHIEIGVRPAYPAEFIVVRIGIWQGGSQISEG